MEWELCNTRRLSIQGAIAWHHGIGSYFQDRYLTGIRNTLAYYDGRKTEFYFDKDHHANFNVVLDKSLDDHEFVTSMIPEAMVFLQEKHDELAYLLQDAETLAGRELATLFEEFVHHYNDFFTRKWMAYRISGRIVQKMQQELQEKMSEDDARALVQLFAIPLVPNDVTNERIDLLKLAVKGATEQDIAYHTKKYCHIPLFDLDHEPYSEEHFTATLATVQKPKEELQSIQNSFKERIAEYETALESLQPAKKLKKLIAMMKRAAFFRDHGDTMRQKVNLVLLPLYNHIGNELGLERKDVCLLTNDEILHLLRHGKRFDPEELKKRKQAFLLQQLGDHVEVYSGGEAREKATILEKTSENASELQGIVGSPGNVKGKVRVIHTNLDLKSCEEEEIIVTTMTRQDFVPYMRKAAAIITDEGSLISHAAVICRELGIPCVVGTKFATKMLKTGDNVIVEDGVVRKA